MKKPANLAVIGSVLAGIALLVVVQFVSGRVLTKKSLFVETGSSHVSKPDDVAPAERPKVQSLGEALQPAVAEQNAKDQWEPESHKQAAAELNRLSKQVDEYLQGVDIDSPETVLQAAKAGEPDAQYQMGVNHQIGWDGFEKDPKQAFSWYKKAAEQNHMKAQNDIGNAYWRGDGVAQDLAVAASWYHKSAIGGFAVGQKSYADMLLDGQGVPQDVDAALIWYERAARQGERSAGLSLITIHQTGDKIPQDFEQAFYWADHLAAENPSGYGQHLLAQMYEKGEGVDANMDMALYYYRQAAAEDWGDAQYNLGSMFLDGRGVAPDREQGVVWLKKAMKNHSRDAKLKLAQLGVE